MVSKIWDELRFGKRMIFTNVEFRLEPWIFRGRAMRGLAHVLLSRYGSDFNVKQRLVYLPQSSVQHFFRHRARFDARDLLVERTVLPAREDKLFALDEDLGAMYIIDEAHEYFSQRDWTGVGSEAISWASQNRRAGDDCWLLSQSPLNVAVSFRRQCVECWVMANLHMRRFWKFRQADKIVYSVFLETPPGKSDIPMYRGELSFDRADLEESYDTTAGASVSGGAGDVGERREGIPWKWLKLGIAGVAVLAAVAVWAVFKTLDVLAKHHSLPGSAAFASAGGSEPLRYVLRPSLPASMLVAETPVARAVPHAGMVDGEPRQHIGVDEFRHSADDSLPVIASYGTTRGSAGWFTALNFEDGSHEILPGEATLAAKVLTVSGQRFRLDNSVVYKEKKEKNENTAKIDRQIHRVIPKQVGSSNSPPGFLSGQ